MHSMNSLSITLRYRPVRVGWCVRSGDFDALRRAVRQSCTLWGGLFNPIIPTDDPELANRLVREYRVDVLMQVSDGEDIKQFIDGHKHLPWPFFDPALFIQQLDGRWAPALVDISHPARRIHEDLFRGNAQPESVMDLYEWEPHDPLADVFLCGYGSYPDPAEMGIHYYGLAQTSLLGQRYVIPLDGDVPIPNQYRYAVSSLTAALMEQHHSVRNNWDYPGFYIGEADNFLDLVHFWNLRATGNRVQFFDPRYATRLEAKATVWRDWIEQQPPHGSDRPRVAVWHRRERGFHGELHRFGEHVAICAVDPTLWNGLNLAAPEMYFAGTTALATVGDRGGSTTIAFGLSDKPFWTESTYPSPHYVLSVDPGIGLFQSDRETLHTPFIPELNEFYGRNCHHTWNQARAEPESLGIITEVSADNLSLRALNVPQLVKEIFESAGIEATPSRPGLVASTLIRQMGGLDSCRAFKVAGVRELIERHRPDQSFSRATAKQTIRAHGTDHDIASYDWLYIEPRPSGVVLTADAVLSHLLDKGVFRAGLEFSCPSCQLNFWRSLDDAKARLECEYCGHIFNTGPQLRDKDWAFRRSGLFGRDDHQEGAIPVLLALQQLVRGHELGNDSLYTTALELKPKAAAIEPCETDLVVVHTGGRDRRTQVIIGECKSNMPITVADVRKLKAVADAFPTDRFDVYVVFVRLSPFSADEVEAIKQVNARYTTRPIMFTARELEPYFTYERTAKEYDIEKTAVSFDDMARNTISVFFENRIRQAE